MTILDIHFPFLWWLYPVHVLQYVAKSKSFFPKAKNRLFWYFLSLVILNATLEFEHKRNEFCAVGSFNFFGEKSNWLYMGGGSLLPPFSKCKNIITSNLVKSMFVFQTVNFFSKLLFWALFWVILFCFPFLVKFTFLMNFFEWFYFFE